MNTRDRNNEQHAATAFYQVDPIAITDRESLADVKAAFTHDTRPSAVVIGMGPGGLATAITLQQQGYNVLIAEKRGEFSRSNIIGINKAALGWFKDHDLINELVASSNKTLDFPTLDNLATRHATTSKDVWLDMTSKTANTISIKSLQKLLLKRFQENGGHYVSKANVSIDDLNQLSINQWNINLDNVDMVIVADGAGSQLRERLNTLQQAANTASLAKINAIPTHSFSNVIISPVPEGLAPSVYIHTDAVTGHKMAFSVSAHDISLNYQTTKVAGEESDATVTRLLQEAHFHAQNFLSEKSLALSGNEHYYPINGGKLQAEYNASTFGDVTVPMRNVIFQAPATRANHMVYANKFVLLGDAKGTSSPMAGLGASVALAFDPVIIRDLAQDLQNGANKTDAFKQAESALHESVNIWHTRTMKVLNIDTARLSTAHTSLWKKPANDSVVEQQATVRPAIGF